MWLLTALWLLFMTLKLTGHIKWSWWWVLSPLWLELILSVVILSSLGAY